MTWPDATHEVGGADESGYSPAGYRFSGAGGGVERSSGLHQYVMMRFGSAAGEGPESEACESSAKILYANLAVDIMIQAVRQKSTYH